MSAILQVLIAIFLPAAFEQGIVQEPIQAQYYEAMAAASAEGLPALVLKLDAAANAFPSSAFAPRIYETIQMIGLLHPGSVPDQAARLQAMKAQVSGNPVMAKVLRRLEIAQEYYAASAKGRPETAAAALTDSVFEGSLLGTQAMADFSLRSRDYVKAEALAEQIIEADPYSPLLANAYVILGLCDAYRGRLPGAARRFQHAWEVSPLLTLYGNTQDYLAIAYRFARPQPGAVMEIFDEMTVTRLAGTQGLKDPHAMLFAQGKFILVDREQVLTLSMDGKVTEAKAGKGIEDFAEAPTGKLYYLADDGIDLGTGTRTPLSASIGGKAKALKKLRSLSVDARGEIFLLDQDAGLLSAIPAAGALSPAAIAPVRGRLLRIDRRGNLYVLAQDQRSIIVLSRDGKQIASLSPVPSAGKEPSIEYFALDSINHVYILDSNSIQVFALNDGSSGIEKAKVSVLPFDPRPQFKNLRVIAVTSTGEMAVTGKNEDNWVLFR